MAPMFTSARTIAGDRVRLLGVGDEHPVAVAVVRGSNCQNLGLADHASC